MKRVQNNVNDTRRHDAIAHSHIRHVARAAYVMRNEQSETQVHLVESRRMGPQPGAR